MLIHLPVLSPWLSADPIIWWSGLAFHPPCRDLLVPGYPGWADGNAGVTTEALGHLAAGDWLHGVIPWWNPFSGVGMPLAAEMQNSALFLPFVLLLHLAGGVLLLKIALQILTGLASFALLRTLRIHPAIACLCAVLAEFNGTYAWYSHGPIMPVAFLPLLLLGIERCRLAVLEGRNGGPALVAVAVAYSIYAGFPETAFLDGLLASVVVLARLFVFPNGTARRDFAFRIMIGAIGGLLLSAPASVAFLDFLRHAYLSVHADYSFADQLPGNAAMLVLPYVFGPPLFNFFTTGHGQQLWWDAGGYISLPLLFLSLWSLLDRNGREIALRSTLGLWLVATFAKAAGFPVAVAFWDLIPGVRHTLFPVYITPTWEFAAIILVAFALDDWVSRPSRRHLRRAWSSLAVAMVLTGAALWAARPEMSRLASAAPHYLLISIPLMGMTIGATIAVAIFIAGKPTRRRLAALTLVVAAETLVNFAVPLLSAASQRPLDQKSVAFLRMHLGLQRFYSVSVFQPNYGAYERLAQVNHNYLPVPQDWVDFLHAKLSRSMDGVQFFGGDLRLRGAEPLASLTAPETTTKSAVELLAGLGVRYILVPHGTDPFSDVGSTPILVRDNQALPLPPDLSMSVSLPFPERYADGDISSVAVDIGTYRNVADGSLAITLCSAQVCRRTGAAPLHDAHDNALLWMSLDKPLSVTPRTSLTVTLTHQGGKFGVGIYLWPARAGGGVTTGSDHRSTDQRLPLLAFAFEPRGLPPPRVYGDQLIDIYELPAAAPYASAASGRCRLAIADRRTVSADCEAADELVRRELFFPGWHATVNGRQVTIQRAGELFQAVSLPAGRSMIRFSYRPPFMRLAYAAMLLGLTLLLLPTLGQWRRVVPGRRP